MIDPRITKVRFQHPAPEAQTLFGPKDLSTALQMAEEGGSVDVYLADHERWFELVQGMRWRLDTLRAVLASSDEKGQRLSERRRDERDQVIDERDERYSKCVKEKEAIEAERDQIRAQLLTELAEWCEAKRDEDAAFADEHGQRRETEPSRAGAHKSAREMHLDHANAFREVADHCRELAEKEPGAQEPNANLRATAQNVVNAWDNPSPGPEKWDRLREKIGYLREALQ